MLYGAYVTDLEFDLQEVKAGADDGQATAIIVRLVPRFDGGLLALSLPPQGLPGEIILHSVGGTDTRPAVLLPRPVLELKCCDPSIGWDGKVWQIHQRDPVSLPMQVTTQVPIWIQKVNANEAAPGGDIIVEGFEEPVRLGPDKPYPFSMRVNSSSWQPNTEMPFRFEAGPNRLEAQAVIGWRAPPGGRKQTGFRRHQPAGAAGAGWGGPSP